MLTALDFWHLVEHIIPVYVIVIVAYGLTRLKLIEPEHGPGISRWVSLMGVPTYVFHLLAFNDPYKTSLRFVAADVLSKALALFGSCLWWRLSRSGSIDGVIGFFMLATLPNTVLIGDALLQPLYGDEVHTQVVTIIFMQSLLWYNLCICLYETRAVLLEEEENSKQAAVIAPFEKEQHRIIDVHSAASGLDASTGFPVEWRELQTRLMDDGDSRKEATLERTISAPAGFFRRSSSLSLKCTLKSRVCDLDIEGLAAAGGDLSGPLAMKKVDSTGAKVRALSADEAATVLTIISTDAQQQSQNKKDPEDEDPEIIIFSEKSGNLKKKLSRAAAYSSTEIGNEDEGIRKFGNFARWGILGLKIFHRMKKAPLTFASIAGFIYSLVAQKYKWDMPYPIRTSLELISQGAIGMAIFLMGMAWARSGRLISCGWKALVYGILVRFLVGPILMIICAEAVAMHGRSFRFAVLQAVIPQGVISFVLAKEYGVDVPLFNTAVIFQLVIFLPIVLCYYYTLEQL